MIPIVFHGGQMSFEVNRCESLTKSSMYLGTLQSILQDRCPLHFWTILVNNTESCKPLSNAAAHEYEQGITKSFDFLVLIYIYSVFFT